MNPSEKIEFLKQRLRHDPIINAVVLNMIRVLGKVHPTDGGHQAHRDASALYREDFFHLYHLLWHIGAVINPQNIMEIGCRTGTSICHLLSAMPDHEGKHVVLFDAFIDVLNVSDEELTPITEKMVKANIEYLNLPVDKVKFVVGLSAETVPNYREENPDIRFDYILVDAGHTYELAKIDMENSAEMLAPGGVLLMDDLVVPSLHKLWNEFKAERRDEFLFAQNVVWHGLGVGVKK